MINYPSFFSISNSLSMAFSAFFSFPLNITFVRQNIILYVYNYKVKIISINSKFRYSEYKNLKFYIF